MGTAMFQVDAKIQCDKNTEFYLQHEKDGIEWFILLFESPSCAGKPAFQSAWNIERPERNLRAEALEDMSRNLHWRKAT